MRWIFRTSLLLALLTTIAWAQSNPVPLINQLEPVSARPGRNGFLLKVIGQGFAPNAIVNWNGSSRITEVISSTRVEAEISAGDVAKAGSALVTVVNPAPGGGTSNQYLFPVRRPLSALALAPEFGLTGTTGVAVADLNNDGKLDVLVTESQNGGESGSINVFYGNGDGTFQPPIQTDTSFEAWGPVIGDFNGDGILDVAVESPQSSGGGGWGFVVTFLGTGDGHFVQISDNNPPGFSPWAVGDFNGDGKLDLVTESWDYGLEDLTFSVYLGNGDGTYVGGGQGLGISCCGFGPTLADFNQDGNLDLAIVGEDGEGDGYLFVAFGNGDGTFQKPVTYPASRTQSSVIAADVNGDGILDLVTDDVCVYLGSRNGTFGTAQCNGYGDEESAIAAGDFNGDGKIDLVTYDSYHGNILILLGNGDGTFQNPIAIATPSSIVVALGDFNQDGMLDLVTFDSAGVELFLQTTASVSPTTLSFGSQAIGVPSQPQAVTLTNIGKTRLKISQIAIAGADPGDFSQTNNCAKVLLPGDSCQIQAIFDPTALGPRSADIAISSPGLAVPVQTVPMSGTGVTITVSLTPTGVHFGTQLINTRSEPRVATLTATGDYQVSIQSITVSTTFAQSNNCPATLYPNSNCYIHIWFEPTQAGPAKGTLTVTDNATGSPQTITLSGTGTVVELSPRGVNFGDEKVGDKSPEVPVTLTNVGTTQLNISGITITGKDSNDFGETSKCGESVPPGGHCEIEVWFSPTTKGRRNAALQVQDDGGGSPQSVPLAGNGT
jgi:hypothetical protein